MAGCSSSFIASSTQRSASPGADVEGEALALHPNGAIRVHDPVGRQGVHVSETLDVVRRKDGGKGESLLAQERLHEPWVPVGVERQKSDVLSAREALMELLDQRQLLAGRDHTRWPRH